METWPARKEYPGLGSQLWEYCVPYQADMNKVLAELKDREFKAGRFHRSELKPKSFAEAIRNADAAGTRSIMESRTAGATRVPGPFGLSIDHFDVPRGAAVDARAVTGVARVSTVARECT